MTRFRFRLETLLKVRRQQRDVRREALAKAIRAEEIVADRIAEVETEIAKAQDAQRNGLETGTQVNVDRLLNQGRHELTLRAKRQDLQQQKQQIAEERDRRQAALVEADRAVKVLEKLKEKLAMRFRRQQEKEESRQLDAIAEQRFHLRERVEP